MPTGMLKGTYIQSMDAKGRMTFPTKLREVIGEQFVVTRGLDGCLFVYSTEDFEKKAEAMKNLPLSKARVIQRRFMAGACDVAADKQGRILVPANLREEVGLEKDIVVVGVSDRCEIWDKQHWDDFNSSIDENDLAQALEGLDF